MECNKEHLFRMVDERLAAKLCADFESDWEKSTTVTQNMIDAMMAKHRGRSRSQSEGSGDRSVSEPREELQRPVSLSRDLTTELDAVAEEDRKGANTASSVVPFYP
eukprot:9639609-Karenia_brevis.AAC.1